MTTSPAISRPFRTVISLLTLAIISLLNVCAATAADHHYVIPVGEFTRIKLSADANVVYRNVPDSAGMVAFDASDRVADAYTFDVRKGTLRISLDHEWTTPLPTVYVYSSFLSGVENEEGGSITVFSPAPAPEFEAKMIGNGSITADNVNATQVTATFVTGNGSITITGNASAVSASMAGAGKIDLSYLSADKVAVKAVGSGWISCWARKELSVMGLGSTKIYYRGNPTITRKGTSQVLPISEKTVTY